MHSEVYDYTNRRNDGCTRRYGKSGKILYIGISGAPAWIVSRANTLANLKGWMCMRPNTVKYGSI
jgi:hypothetical protein